MTPNMISKFGNMILLAGTVAGIGYAFIAMAVFAGLVEPSSVPLWPTETIECAQAPRFAVRQFASGVTVRVDDAGEYTAETVADLVREQGYRVQFTIIPAVPEHAERFLPDVVQTPANVDVLMAVQPSLDRAVGRQEILLGPGFDEGEWMLTVGCHTADGETPTYLG